MSANESRRRADPLFQQKVENTIALVPFEYQKLDDKVDSTRFIQIESADDQDAPLVCSLTHVAFRGRPRFDALSYRWGDEANQGAITLNGCHLNVRKNLLDALVFLRRQGKTGLLWVDAICINQEDINERTRQVRNMGHIYFRAASVIVWLGGKYSNYQQSLKIDVAKTVDPATKAEQLTDGGRIEEEKQTEASLAERDMVRQLVKDEYWNRVWIIQEVGQNEMKRVCFGHWEVGWDDFIHFVTMHNCEGGPLRLSQQLSQKYVDAHTLRKLLIDHIDAQCENSKDKIYGLVGLAFDARGFPIDYKKSLLVIWNDTMEFMNKRRLFITDRETDIIYIGGLVKALLMGANCSPFRQIAQQVEPQLDSQIIVEDRLEQSSDPRVFHVAVYVLGCISYIGPTAEEIAADLRRTDEWAEQLQENYVSDLGNAHKESNQLMRAVLNASADELQQTCFNCVGLIKSCGDFRGVEQYKEINVRHLKSSNGGPTATHASQNTTSIGNVNLFQMRNVFHRDLPWKTGVVSGQARPTDLVCWLKGTEKAVVVRLQSRPGYSLPTLQVVGTALVAEDMTEAMVDHETLSNRFHLLASLGSNYRSPKSLNLKMDARTVFVLLPEKKQVV
ncbi:HET-domain-containing protein [Colletotrichum somersetense]|nr:HET-domain-containing protein [Colletotrichum somersetense]